jgi:2-isopropylmalate synthase
MKDKIIIHDTTLRDGAQTPFIGMDFWDRYVIAKALANIGVDVIEIGFAANDVDYEPMKKIAKHIGSRKYSRNKMVPVVCSLARVLDNDVNLAYETIEPADPDKRRIHVFIGTSEELMNYSHGKREEEILSLIKSNVAKARELLGKEGQVEYSSEDALRTDFAFLVETIQTAIDNGADVINVPDTTGFARPDKYYETIMEMKRRVKGIEGTTLSAHIHNDSGNAVASTMKGIEAGIRQVEGTILQLGERAGNVDWFTVVTNLKILREHYKIDVNHIDAAKFNDLARLVSSITRHPIPLTHPVVGKAAFSESAGIHVKGVINNYQTYFVIPPELVGKEIDIVLGQTSGRNTVAYFLRRNGYGELGKDYTLEQLDRMTSAIKRYSIEIKDGLTSTESKIFAEHYIRGKPLERRVELIDFNSRSSRRGKPSIEIVLRVDGEERRGTGRGEGPVDAYMVAIEEASGITPCDLKYWEERAAYHGRGAYGFEILDEMEFSDEENELIRANGGESRGQEAVAESLVEVLYDRGNYHGRGVARDITLATYEAITNAFDAIFRLKKPIHKGRR